MHGKILERRRPGKLVKRAAVEVSVRQLEVAVRFVDHGCRNVIRDSSGVSTRLEWPGYDRAIRIFVTNTAGVPYARDSDHI